MNVKTKRLTENKIKEAAGLLLDGEIVAFPTETVYGLGAIYDNEESFKRLCIVKNRPADKPFTLMCGKYEDIERVSFVSDKARRVITHFMPGEITVLLPVKDNVPNWVTMNSKKIGVRIPNYSLTLNLLREVGKPLLVPSANKSYEKPAFTSEEVLSVFDGEIAGVILGYCSNGRPSTIVDLSEENIKLIREGNVPFNEIVKIWEDD